MKMLKNIPISQQLVDWSHELERYYYGDLEHIDSADWLRNVDQLNRNIANEVRRVQGKSIVLTVSNEAILDLVRESDQPSLAQKFASFLSGRLSGVNLQVSKSLENMVPLDTPITDQSYKVLVAEAWEYANDRELVKTPNMGNVWVTRHAVDRYLERNSSAVDGIRAP